MGAELTTKCLAFSDNHQLLGWEPRPLLRPLRKCSPGLLLKAAASSTLFSETREKSLQRKASFELPICSLEAITWVWLPSALGTFQVVSREHRVLQEGLDKPDVLALRCDIIYPDRCNVRKKGLTLAYSSGGIEFITSSWARQGMATAAGCWLVTFLSAHKKQREKIESGGQTKNLKSPPPVTYFLQPSSTS